MDLLTPLITDSGWIYSVGSLHDFENGVFGRPMYYPDENGERLFNGRRYNKYLRRPELHLLPSQLYAGCTQIDPWSVLVPKDRITEIIDTRRAFARWIRDSDPRVRIVERLLTTAGVTLGQCGLGGSAGVGCETVASDVDILLYGSASALACRRAIEDALLGGEIDLMTQDVVASYAERYSRLYGIDRSYLHSIFAGDLTKVYYQGRKISFIFAYGENERDKIPLQLYTESASQALEIRLRARVVDGSASWVYPRKYIVEQQHGQLYQAWSHHWLRDPVTPTNTLVEVVGRDLGGGVISMTDLAHHIVPLTS
jgi:predicted nucleotidyltransferase